MFCSRVKAYSKVFASSGRLAGIHDGTGSLGPSSFVYIKNGMG